MRSPFARITASLLLTGGLLLSQSVHAEFIPVNKGVEADHVRILFTEGVEIGKAQVNGCKACPLHLDIDGQTRFFQKGSEIERRKVSVLSGKSATVIYSMDGKQALRIRW